MLKGPEYTSYRDFMRELDIGGNDVPGREWQDGDWYVDSAGHVGLIGAPGAREADPYWLPRLDQWLAMLEEAGIHGVLIERDGDVFTVTSGEGSFDEGVADTREEACARLWMAVTGRDMP